MIYEGILFNDEIDILRLHLAVMYPVVDRFVIVEGAYTFRGEQKPGLTYPHMKHEIPQFADKIFYLVDNGPPFPNPWDNEKRQRNYIAAGLKDTDPDDIVIISDADEIPSPEYVKAYQDADVQDTRVFATYAYYYYLNYLMIPQDVTTTHGIVITRRCNITTPQNMRDMRLSAPSYRGGWHFGWLGRVENIQRKLHQFSHAEYDTEYWTDPVRLEQAIKDKKDILDRDLRFQKVPIQYPSHPHYLVDHQDEFKEYIHD